MVDVIGAGFGRTGTASLKKALELIGFAPCHHMVEVIKDPGTAAGWTAALGGDLSALQSVLARYRAVVDFPGALVWRELLELYPQAKVVLTVRDPKKWYDSAAATILRQDTRGEMTEHFAKNPAMADFPAFRDAMSARGLRRDLTEDEAIAFFNQHNETVRATVESGRLLVYEVAQGWGPLCEFLGAEVPEMEFPRVNESASFQKNVQRLVETGVADFE
ncbi:sulfotransferase family protein [Actinocrispum sp. NPDC049592]|uniref:sulfotransferase family protein n=1 Tax=Actinocrispum sp. NPDC049592 TaxID=3154835 RepID=UPI0034487C1B